MSIDEKVVCKNVESRIVKYFNDMRELESYQSQLQYYKENMSIFNTCSKDKMDKINNEIDNTKLKIAEIKFKNKSIEEMINSFTEEEKEYLKLRYKEKLTVVGVRNALYMCEKTYYKTKRNIIGKLSSVVL